MKRDLIFVFFGGTMTGVFGAGVARALAEHHLENRLQSIYATSVGAHNAAYLLSGQTAFLPAYYEDFSEHKLIHKSKVFKIFLQLIWRFFYPKAKLETLIDLDYLLDIEKHQKKLDLRQLSQSPVNFYIRVFNVDRRKEEYLDGRIGTWAKLKATSAVIPFYPRLVRINHQHYFDGDSLSLGIDPHLEKIIRDNKDKKIFLVLNFPEPTRTPWLSIVGNTMWTSLLFLYFRKKFVFRKLRLLTENKKLYQYENYPRVKIIAPDYNLLAYCTRKSELEKFYHHGLKKAEKIFRAEKLI